jgi:hypothetical protein
MPTPKFLTAADAAYRKAARTNPAAAAIVEIAAAIAVVAALVELLGRVT